MFSFSLDRYPKVEFLDHIVALLLILESSATSFSIVDVQLHTPIVHKGSNSSTSSPTFLFCVFFHNIHPSGTEMISECSFDLHFPSD